MQVNKLMNKNNPANKEQILHDCVSMMKEGIDTEEQMLYVIRSIHRVFLPDNGLVWSDAERIVSAVLSSDNSMVE